MLWHCLSEGRDICIKYFNGGSIEQFLFHKFEIKPDITFSDFTTKKKIFWYQNCKNCEVLLPWPRSIRREFLWYISPSVIYIHMSIIYLGLGSEFGSQRISFCVSVVRGLKYHNHKHFLPLTELGSTSESKHKLSSQLSAELSGDRIIQYEFSRVYRQILSKSDDLSRKVAKWIISISAHRIKKWF